MAEKKWFVVHTYSGYENKAKKALEDRIKSEKLSDSFGEILIPIEIVVETVKGEKKEKKLKSFPSYILVEMEMNDLTKHLVKNTPKVTNFVGGDDVNPAPVPRREIERLKAQLQQGSLSAPKPKVTYAEGDTIRVVDGPFATFSGLVQEVQSDKNKLRVEITIFGRATPVTLDFMQVEKTS